jgi:heme-degrading monooxygenase HmoA
MFARVSRYHGDPGKVKEAFSAPSPSELNDIPGYLGAYSLVDEKSGKAITMTLWETEEAMLNSIEIANRLRQEVSDEAGGTEKPTYEMYEVVEVPEFVKAAGVR